MKSAAKWHEHACDRYVAEHQALQDLGRAVRVLLGLGWSMRRVITWARAVEPRPTSSADFDIRTAACWHLWRAMGHFVLKCAYCGTLKCDV